MKNLVILSGAGMSAESGISTFRDAGGLWDKYPVDKQNYPEHQIQAAIAWIEAGMSLKKLPAEKVWTKRQIPPATWNIIYGEYKESLRLCFLPADEKGEHGYWFGFESEIQKASPVFKART